MRSSILFLVSSSSLLELSRRFLAVIIFLFGVEDLNLCALRVSSFPVSSASFLGLGLGIKKRDGALGRLELGSFTASTISFFGMFREPFGRVGLLGEAGIGPRIGQISTRLDFGGLEFLE